MLTLNQTHDKKFHCTYLLHYYPFDTQICRVDLQLEKFSQRNVELLPDTMMLLTDTELTQYYIQTWSLDFNDRGSENIKNINLIKQIIRYSIKWSEDGDSVQAAADQRAADHLPPLLPPAADVLRHHILQTFLLRGRSDSQPVHTAGHHHIVYKVMM